MKPVVQLNQHIEINDDLQEVFTYEMIYRLPNAIWLDHCKEINAILPKYANGPIFQSGCCFVDVVYLTIPVSYDDHHGLLLEMTPYEQMSYQYWHGVQVVREEPQETYLDDPALINALRFE